MHVESPEPGSGRSSEHKPKPCHRLVRWAVLLSFVALGLAVAAATLHLGVVPAIALPLPDVGFDSRPTLFVDWRLAALKNDPITCRDLLTDRRIDARPAATHLRSNGCGWYNAWRVRKVAGARLSPSSPVMRCEHATALALWMVHDVQPAARGILGSPVAIIRHMGTYNCRAIRGGRKMLVPFPSQHSFANAIDIGGFVLADGRRVDLIRHWRSGARGRFLRRIYADSCKWFRVKLGPASNRAHRDHFHLDRGWAFSRCAVVRSS